MDAKAEKTNEKEKKKRNCPRPGTNTPPTVSEVLILSLMRSACVSPALITSADSLRIDMCRGSPSSRMQPVKVTVTGREVAVQSNYAADDGWVIGRDWQEGYGGRVTLYGPSESGLKTHRKPGNWDENHWMFCRLSETAWAPEGVWLSNNKQPVTVECISLPPTDLVMEITACVCIWQCFM